MSKTKIFVAFFIINVIFFLPFFYPTTKVLVTPEFGGGDTSTITIPFKKFYCDDLKSGKFSFWSRDMSLGYPLYVEGETGFFNPVNVLTCLLFDYKTAFTIEFVIYTIIVQLGLFLLIKELKLSDFTAVYGAIVFSFAPIIILNYLHILLVYTLFIFPFILLFSLRLLKKASLRNFFFLSLSVSAQFLVGHYQVFFMSFIFTLIFLAGYVFIFRKSKKLTTVLKLFGAYVFGVLLVGFQSVPVFEFLMNSNRSIINSMSYGVLYDQNLNLFHLVTLVLPYFFGSPQNGTYPWKLAPHPWESVVFIYFAPLILLSVSVWVFVKKRSKIILVLFVSLFVTLLLALGKNSPLYLIHHLPIFSSFRFPSRYILLAVFSLTLISCYGLEYVLERLKGRVKYLFFTVIMVSILFQARQFSDNFHVLLPESQIYKETEIISYLKQKGNVRLYTPMDIAHTFIDSAYGEKGYKKDSFYHDYVNDVLLGNTSLIHGIMTMQNKVGPQLRRYSYLFDLATFEVYDEKTREATMSSVTKKTLALAGIDYLLSPFPIKENSLDLVKKIKRGIYTVFLYKNRLSKGRLQFFDNVSKVSTYAELFKEFSTDNFDTAYIEESLKMSRRSGSPGSFKYRILVDSNDIFKVKTESSKEGLLVYASMYYPGWKIYVDGKRSRILRANLFFFGTDLKKGSHTVEFRFEPHYFYVGVFVTIATVTLAAMFYWLKKRSFKVF